MASAMGGELETWRTFAKGLGAQRRRMSRSPWIFVMAVPVVVRR